MLIFALKNLLFAKILIIRTYQLNYSRSLKVDLFSRKFIEINEKFNNYVGNYVYSIIFFEILENFEETYLGNFFCRLEGESLSIFFPGS